MFLKKTNYRYDLYELFEIPHKIVYNYGEPYPSSEFNFEDNIRIQNYSLIFIKSKSTIKEIGKYVFNPYIYKNQYSL